MGFFGSEPRRRKSKRAVLNSLKRRIAKKQRAVDKKREKLRLSKEIEMARKKLRGY